jgi:hypothetical protein
LAISVLLTTDSTFLRRTGSASIVFAQMLVQFYSSQQSHTTPSASLNRQHKVNIGGPSLQLLLPQLLGVPQASLWAFLCRHPERSEGSSIRRCRCSCLCFAQSSTRHTSFLLPASQTKSIGYKYSLKESQQNRMSSPNLYNWNKIKDIPLQKNYLRFAIIEIENQKAPANSRGFLVKSHKLFRKKNLPVTHLE